MKISETDRTTEWSAKRTTQAWSIFWRNWTDLDEILGLYQFTIRLNNILGLSIWTNHEIEQMKYFGLHRAWWTVTDQGLGSKLNMNINKLKILICFWVNFWFKWMIVNWKSNRTNKYEIGLDIDKKNYWITTNGFSTKI